MCIRDSLGFAGGCTAPARPRPSPVLASGFKTARDHALTGTNAAIKRLVRTQSAQPDGDHRSRPLLPGLLKPGSWSSLATRISSCRWGVRSLSRSVPRRPRTAVVFRPVRWSTRSLEAPAPSTATSRSSRWPGGIWASAASRTAMWSAAVNDPTDPGRSITAGRNRSGGPRRRRRNPIASGAPGRATRILRQAPRRCEGNPRNGRMRLSWSGAGHRRPSWSRESCGPGNHGEPAGHRLRADLGRAGVGRPWRRRQALAPLAVGEDERDGHSTPVRPDGLLAFPFWAPVLGGFEPYGDLVRRLRRHSVDDAAVVDVNAARLATTIPRNYPATTVRLRDWEQRASRNSMLLWIGHGFSRQDEGSLYVPGEPRPDGLPEMDDELGPAAFADHLIRQAGHRQVSGSWAIVVIEACGAGRYVDLVHQHLNARNRTEGLLLVGSGNASGDGHLGRFRQVLDRVYGDGSGLRLTTNDTEITLQRFGLLIKEGLGSGGHVYIPHGGGQAPPTDAGLTADGSPDHGARRVRAAAPSRRCGGRADRAGRRVGGSAQ